METDLRRCKFKKQTQWPALASSLHLTCRHCSPSTVTKDSSQYLASTRNHTKRPLAHQGPKHGQMY